MCSRGVLIHCPSRLGATAAVLATELQGSDAVFATLARERDQAVGHFDGVMSHSFKCSRLSRCDAEPKLPLATRHQCLEEFAPRQSGVASSGWCSTPWVLPRQVRISVLQLCIFVAVPQLPLHAGIAALALLVLFHCTFAAILILRFFHKGFSRRL